MGYHLNAIRPLAVPLLLAQVFSYSPYGYFKLNLDCVPAQQTISLKDFVKTRYTYLLYSTPSIRIITAKLGLF